MLCPRLCSPKASLGKASRFSRCRARDDIGGGAVGGIVKFVHQGRHEAYPVGCLVFLPVKYEYIGTSLELHETPYTPRYASLHMAIWYATEK